MLKVFDGNGLPSSDTVFLVIILKNNSWGLGFVIVPIIEVMVGIIILFFNRYKKVVRIVLMCFIFLTGITLFPGVGLRPLSDGEGPGIRRDATLFYILKFIFALGVVVFGKYVFSKNKIWHTPDVK